MATKTKSKVIALPAPNFKYGFEIEGAYPVGSRNRIRYAVTSVYPIGARMGDDGSLDFEFDYQTVEIKTPPEPEEQALENIFKLFEKLEALGFKTNSSCGFHVNISESNTFQRSTIAASEKIQKFCQGISMNLKVDSWLRKFKRKTNYFCSWKPYKKNYFADPKTVQSANKFTAINPSNLKGSIPVAQRRLELRIAGNENYHSNYPVMKQYLSEVQQAAHLSYQYAHG